MKTAGLIGILLWGGVLVFGAEGSAAGQRQVGRLASEKINKWHTMFTWGNPREWESRWEEVRGLCDLTVANTKTVYKTEQLENESRFVSGGKNLVVSDREKWRQHREELVDCCQKDTRFDALTCLARMRSDFLDRFCEDGANHVCCTKEADLRYDCFGDHAPSAPKAAVLAENNKDTPMVDLEAPRRENEVQPGSGSEEDPSEPSWPLTREEMESLAPADEDGKALCADDFFPEDGDVVVHEEENGLCRTDDKKAECGGCCKIGAAIGKQRLRKGCPYLQCRGFFKEFYKAHRKCIKHPFACGYYFVTCCERQHYKDLYSSGSSPQNGQDDVTA